MTEEQAPPDSGAARGAAQSHRETASSNQPSWKSLSVGDVEPCLGVKIGEILLNTEEAFVFLTERGEVEWLYIEQPEDSAWSHARVVELESRCAFFKQRSDNRSFTDHTPAKILQFDYRNHERSAKRFIAQGIVILHIGGTKAEAEAAFASAERFINLRAREVSLIWLYSTFGILAAVSTVALLLLSYFRPQGEIFWATLTCTAAGGVGAYISRALASRDDIPCDANAGKRLHMEEALLRWSIGGVAGGLMCLLVRGKVLLGSLPLDQMGFPVILALATLAGMSERFLPSLLNRFNDKLETPEKK